jgi:hypothetical protein
MRAQTYKYFEEYYLLIWIILVRHTSYSINDLQFRPVWLM